MSHNPDDIRAAVKTLFDEASIDPVQRPFSVTPLGELITSFNIILREVQGLTYAKAKSELEKEMRRDVLISEGTQELAGFLYAQRTRGRDYGVVFIRSTDPIPRRRFTAAHELGHYVLHFQQSLNERSETAEILVEGIVHSDEEKAEMLDSPVEGQLNYTRDALPIRFDGVRLQQMEREANQFAAELLMPETGCRALLTTFQARLTTRPGVLIARMASEFLVSEAAMKWRLQNLGLLVLN